MKIVLNNVRKKYRDTVVLDIDELTVEKGKITGITGSNGAGKTTLLNIIAGLDDRYEGSVTYNGNELCSEAMDEMTLVFQKPYLLKRSVYENIAYPLHIRKKKKEYIKEKVMETAKELQIEDLLNKKGHQLSGGESQKVAMARAIALEPKVLLLDEPTSNLDPDSMLILENAVRKYNEKNNATVMVITHNMEQADRICHNQIRLELGRMK
ncbi:MAG: ATP-binding cassette domain-containing protein [Gudongella sp.]|jgi:tungstate transport system ATP-binding protein|nr:ATP-binding cassette domain-containing protein [Gudongella sp.]